MQRRVNSPAAVQERPTFSSSTSGPPLHRGQVRESNYKFGQSDESGAGDSRPVRVREESHEIARRGFVRPPAQGAISRGARRSAPALPGWNGGSTVGTLPPLRAAANRSIRLGRKETRHFCRLANTIGRWQVPSAGLLRAKPFRGSLNPINGSIAVCGGIRMRRLM